MAEFTNRFNPEDSFAKDAVAIYSSAKMDLSAPLTKYHDIESLLQKYTFKDELEQIEIIHFIYKNWFLVSVLKEAPDQALAYFGAGTTLVLEELIDPEDEDGEIELFIVIRPKLKSKIAMQLLDTLVNEWFVDVVPQTGGLLNITVEGMDEF